jgi:hypothetical protein
VPCAGFGRRRRRLSGHPLADELKLGSRRPVPDGAGKRGGPACVSISRAVVTRIACDYRATTAPSRSSLLLLTKESAPEPRGERTLLIRGSLLEASSGSHFFGPVEHRANLLDAGLATLREWGLAVSPLNSARLRGRGPRRCDSLSVRIQIAWGLWGPIRRN